MPTPNPRPLNEKTLTSHDVQVDLPAYDRGELRRSIVHIGVGGFHRSHLATYIDEVCRAGYRNWSIVGGGVLSSDAAIAEALTAQDYLYSLIVRGSTETRVSVVGAIVDYVYAYPDPAPLVERIAKAETEIVSLTITEGGYPIDDSSGLYDPDSPVAGPQSAFGILVSALDVRRNSGTGPVTVMSCDNIMSNGDAARTSTLGEASKLGAELVEWIETNVAFPNSMVDRITPVTSDTDRAWLAAQHGIEDRWPVVAEPFRQWVLEDRFAGDTPPLEEVGVLLTDDVEPYERLKLRLLNASHSGLAYLAALLDFELVDQAMSDDSIRRFVEAFLAEAGSVVPAVPGIDVVEYRQSLIERFANPAIGDQISRLCLDGSAKFPKFLLPTIQAVIGQGRSPELSAFALAGWCQYLLGRNENGSAIERSSDPLLDVAVGHATNSLEEPRAFLRFAEVFAPEVANDPLFADAFERRLSLLRSVGVRSAIGETLLSGHTVTEIS